MYQDFKDLLSAFHAHGVKYLIVGGYAVIFHAQPRATKDIDLSFKRTLPMHKRPMQRLRVLAFRSVMCSQRILQTGVLSFASGTIRGVSTSFPIFRASILTLPGKDALKGLSIRKVVSRRFLFPHLTSSPRSLPLGDPRTSRTRMLFAELPRRSHSAPQTKSPVEPDEGGPNE
jgi:hypothetical protein